MLRRNVLIFHAGGLGDFILTWPLAVGLGRIYPQSRIFYITHKQKGDLAKRVLGLEAIDIESGWHSLFSEDVKLSPANQKMIESAHAIYTFLPATPVWHQNLKSLSPLARCVEINTQHAENYQGHMTEQMTVRLENPERSALQQMLRSIADRGIGYRATGGNDVVMHPGSGSSTKRWPLDRFLQLGEELKTHGKSVRFLIGEVEREKFTSAELESLKAVASLCDCQTYLNLLNQISTAAVFVGNDSGPAHLAGVIGVPTIALFGPTNPLHWQPLGPAVRVVQHPILSELSVKDVLAAIDSLLSVVPTKQEKNEIASDD